FRRLFAELVDVAAAKSVIDPHISVGDPAQFLQPLRERGDAGRCLRIVEGRTYQHPDAPHPLTLLRPRHHRPSRRRATEQRDELAAPHSITSSAVASSLSGTVSPSILA